MSVGERIKELRKAHNLSQEDLANKLCVSRQAITKWENNRGTPDIENLKSIAQLFNISLDYLVSDDSQKSYNLLKETFNPSEYKVLAKNFKSLEDYVVLKKYPKAVKIYPLVREKKLSRLERIFEWFIMPCFGLFDFVDKINNKRKDYLIENNNQLVLVIIYKDTITSNVLPYEFINKKFVYDNYNYIKLDVDGVSELISWAEKNNLLPI